MCLPSVRVNLVGVMIRKKKAEYADFDKPPGNLIVLYEASLGFGFIWIFVW